LIGKKSLTYVRGASFFYYFFSDVIDLLGRSHQGIQGVWGFASNYLPQIEIRVK
jgi:hypothetical protein